MGKCTEMESRLVIARAEGQRDGEWVLRGLLWKWQKYFGTKLRWWFHNIVKVPNANELYSLKQLILYYVNFISIIKKKDITKKYVGIRSKSKIFLFVKIAASVTCQLRNKQMGIYFLPRGQRNRESCVQRSRAENN